MRISIQLKRWVSILMMSCMMFGIVVPAGFAEGQMLQINHTPSEAVQQQDYVIHANITGGEQTVTAAVYYSVDQRANSSLSLTMVNAGEYQATIPSNKLSGSQLEYYFEASDGTAQPIQSNTYKVAIKAQPPISSGPAAPPLLITELVPDTKNIKGMDGTSVDGYEFVEVYNNTEAPIHFNDYYFYYNGKDKWAPDNDIIIPARDSIVFWIMNGNNLQATEASFKQNFNPAADLQEGVNLFRINGGGGMANTAARNLQIRSKAGDAVVVSASYEKQHVNENMGIFYQHPETGSTEMILMLPDSGTKPATPGTVAAEQLLPPIVSIPEINHTPAQTVEAKELEITAIVKNLAVTAEGKLPEVQLLYKTPSQARYTVVPMSKKNGEEYSAIIPGTALVESKLEYKIRVKGATQSYSVNVSLPAFDPAKAPPLLLTEVVPNTANVPNTSTDAYEFIEVYNNTDQPINFKNYKVYYRYPDSGPSADVKWPSIKEDFIIPAQQSVVFWIINEANGNYTANDFNAFYKTNLVQDENLLIIKSGGMANSGRRAIVIKTNTEKEVSAAYYDADTVYDGGTKGDETAEDKGIQYQYPVGGDTTMVKLSSGVMSPTPGVVDPAQIPGIPVHIVPDNVMPTVEDVTGVKTIDQSKSLDLKAFADDDQQITSVEVYVRSDKQLDFIDHNLAQDYNDKLYHYKLSSADLIGRAYIEYYFVVSDGTNETKSAAAKVEVTGGPDQSPLRLNVKDGDILNGARTLKGTAQNAGPDALKLSIDDKELTAKDTFAALENDAYFVFEAKNVDYYFKNAITMGPPELEDKTILYTFMDPIPTYTTLSFPIDSSRLKVGSDNVIYIRAGSKSSPFDPRKEENKDDFEVKNVRLLLADGTEIWDPSYAVRDKEIKMGDSAGKQEWIGFRFDLKPELFKSQAYQWNTKEAADGEHRVTVESRAEKATANVTVDNTSPSIKPSVEEGKLYRGSFTIDAEIKDNYAGVDQVEVKLDDHAISLPYAASSGKLAGGVHKLFIKATDKVGNQGEKLITFEVPEENPYKPELVAPSNGQSEAGTSPKLTVKVQDPTQDPMDVSFFRGFQYNGNGAEGFTGFKNASDTEPPKEMIPSGEQALTAEEYKKISAADGEYLVNESVEQFPYQRFEVKLDPSVRATDRVDIEWEGKSLEGRKVSLYAWSYSSKKWEQLDHVIAGSADFELKATVKAGDYASEQIIQVMVQDEIAASASAPVTQNPYDFSFVWMSDTQYYSQSYPYIYQKNVKWIADNKDKMNLQYVIHTGDIVDKEYQEYQWLEADKDMKVLEDADIPYGVLAGNHDVGHQNNDYTKYWQYFGEERFKKMPTFAGSYDNNRGHYDLVSAGGNDFIIVYMGWGLGDKEIEWMNEVVSKYPERKAILCLHEYLLVSNNRAPIADKIFDKVVKPNKNVIAALSGHYHDAQLKIDELDDDGDGINDRKVYQMLADYQGAEEGGLGYIRLMQFDIQNNKLHIKTYSPYLDNYNYYDPVQYPNKDEFSLDLDLQPKTKRVATDYLGVEVYTDQLIGKNSKVKSGEQTSVTWNGLQPNSYYQWYTKAEDANSGSALSDIWSFYTGKETSAPNPEPRPDPKPNPEPESKPTTGASTPKPVVPGPTTDKGVIRVEPVNGAYMVDRTILEKASSETDNGKIIIRLNSKNSAVETAKLELDAAGINKVKERKLAIEIAAPALTVKLSSASLPDSISDADKVVLHIDTTLNSSIQTSVNASIRGNDELTLTGLVYTLRFVKVKDQKETSVHQFNGPVTIDRVLTDEQKGKLDLDYAGVYYLDGGLAQYIGGEFDGNAVSFTTDHFSQFAVLEYHKNFVDLKGSWAWVNEYVLKLAAKHIVTGTDNNHYGPQLNVTRADLVTLVMRALNLKATDSKMTFADVPQNAYYAGYVAKAAELGLIQGGGGKFRPKDKITREEAAVVLHKMMEYMKKPSINPSSGQAFTDMSSVSGWAKDAVSTLKAEGVIHGKGGNRFDPQGSLTRAEIAKMLSGILKKQDGL